MFKRTKIETIFRWLLRCSWRGGCDFDEEEPTEVGPVWKDEEEGEWRSSIDEGEGVIISYMRQCKRCYRCISRLPEEKEITPTGGNVG